MESSKVHVAIDQEFNSAADAIVTAVETILNVSGGTTVLVSLTVEESGFVDSYSATKTPGFRCETVREHRLAS